MKLTKRAATVLFLSGILSVWQITTASREIVGEEAKIPMKITSAAFKEGETIPRKYTCEGEDISPPLSWTAGPKGTRSFALIADDPDAPTPKPWVHWVIYDLPPTVQNLPEGIPRLEKLANGEKQGLTDFKRIGYGGPCPPSGVHRYYFKLYALDTVLLLKPGATKYELLKAMEGHILAEAQLMGKYEKTKIR